MISKNYKNNLQKDKSHAIILLLLAVFVWGFQPLCLKLIVQDISPLSINFYRYGLASSTVFVILFFRKKTIIIPKNTWIPVFILGILNVALNSIFSFAGLKYSTAINSSLFNAMTPAIVVSLAFIIFKEKLSFLQLIGLIISFLGALWIITGGKYNIIKNLSFNRGDIYFILGQLSWAFYVILSSRILKKIPVLPMVGWSMFLGTIVIGVLGLITHTLEIPHLSIFQFCLLGYIIFIGGLLGMILWNLGVAKSNSSFASVFLVLNSSYWHNWFCYTT